MRKSDYPERLVAPLTDQIIAPSPTAEHTPVPAIASGSDRLTQELGQAIKSGQLMLHFQPRICLKRRQVIGAEALARWPHRRRGMIAPGDFIPLAEQTGLIVPLGRWALAAACAEATCWPADTTVSVNVSAAQLVGGLLLHQVKDALASSGLPPERLELELTESMVVDASIETLLTLSAVRDLGIGLALDDFGTGYTSLAVLKRLPFTAMKLDRSLIRGMLRFPEDTTIVHALIAVGHALKLSIVAEGVDNEVQCRALLGLGCREGQSFFLGKPTTGQQLRPLFSEAAKPPAEIPS